jgi:nuclear pore complex protein Nup107
MDPDAAIRTKKPLHDDDKEDESRLFRYIFHLLRAGQLNEGKALAVRLGHSFKSINNNFLFEVFSEKYFVYSEK